MQQSDFPAVTGRRKCEVHGRCTMGACRSVEFIGLTHRDGNAVGGVCLGVDGGRKCSLGYLPLT